MIRRKRWVLIGAFGLAAAGAGSGLALATGGHDEQPLQGSDQDRATAAALEHTGGGKVIETEVGDGGAAYSVEILRQDGTVVEVSLDRRFNVVGEEIDDDTGTGEDPADG